MASIVLVMMAALLVVTGGCLRYMIVRVSAGGSAALVLDVCQRGDAHLPGQALLPALRHPRQPRPHRVRADDGLRQPQPPRGDGRRDGVRTHPKGEVFVCVCVLCFS